MFEIIDYLPQYHEDFKRLNMEWLEQYQLVEDYDLEVLADPQKKILDGGGYIYLAKCGDVIAGSAGIINEGGGVFELAKMAVAPAFRGKGLSRLLIEKCLNKARQLNAKSVMLYSNSQLKTAISLYEKYGFKHIPNIDSPLLTADVKMELSL
jgi:GNAT superfamily N-acetyltransferase